MRTKILCHTNSAVEASIRRDSNAPIFYARARIESVRIVRGDYPGADDIDARARKYFVFCGIGNPAAFRAELREWGFEIVGHKFFSDHHHYTSKDGRAIESEARAAGANAILCTEKDIFNLADVRMESFDVSYCRISLHIDRQDEFWKRVLTTAQSHAQPAR